MSKICHIVCAGPCDGLDIELGEHDLLVAADGGANHCLDVGLEPHVFIGDFDSVDEKRARALLCERIRLPRDKDDTDTLAACKLGLERGYREFRIHAALGGDVGHEIANVQLLAFLRGEGAHGVACGCAQELHLIDAELSPAHFCAPAQTRVSVFAFGGIACGVFERGLHWELEDATVEPSLPIGVSNRVEEGPFEIGVRSGMLIVVIG